MRKFEVWYTYVDTGSKIVCAEDESDAAERLMAEGRHLEVLNIDQIDDLGEED